MSRTRRLVPAGFDDADRDLVDVLASLEGAVNYASWLAALIGPHARGRILEIGAGSGTITERLIPFGAVTALEPSAALAGSLRERLGGQVAVVEGTLEQLGGHERFDTAVMVNVLEHLPDDADALRRLFGHLADEGRLVLWVPAFEALYGRFDQMIGHHRRYRRAELVDVCRNAGFDVIDCRYANLPGFFAWWLIVRVLRRVPTAGGLSTLYDRLAVPVIRRVERRLRMPFGQSLLLVAARPASS
ncbi:MAG: class I SAM-dependent methyltransferase [Ilumatobacteraceae bacterium]